MTDLLGTEFTSTMTVEFFNHCDAKTLTFTAAATPLELLHLLETPITDELVLTYEMSGGNYCHTLGL